VAEIDVVVEAEHLLKLANAFDVLDSGVVEILSLQIVVLSVSTLPRWRNIGRVSTSLVDG